MKKKRVSKKRVKKNFFRDAYFDSWNYLKESQRFIWAIVIIFSFFLLVGVFVPTPEDLSLKIFEYLKFLISQTEGMNAFQLIWFIFTNNVQTSFYGLVLGVFLGIFSIVATIVNGYLIGFVILLSVREEGLLILWKLFPHGIFELPAVFISLGLGLKLGTFYFHKNRLETFRKYFSNSLKVFFLIVLPLLVIAAIIEGSLMAYLPN